MLYAKGAKWRRMCQYRRTLLGQVCVRVVTKWKEDSGAELVEAALVIPMLLVLLLGIVTFGRAWNVYQTITRAAREGCKEAVLTPCAIYPGCPGSNTIYDAATIRKDFVEPAMKASHIDPSKIINYTTTYVYLDPTDATPDVCGIQIAFQYPYTFMLPFTGINFTSINLSAKVQMRMENQPASGNCPVGGAVP